MKQKIQNILNKYLNQHLSKENLLSLYLELKEYFKSQHLEDLQFKIFPNEVKINEIEIKGIRLIDVYALVGILK